MIVRRREALQGLLYSLGSLSGICIFSAKLLESISYFKVVYRSKKTTETGNYLAARHKWGNVNDIRAISRRYSDRKELLHFSFSENRDELCWSYIFISEKSFNRWNDEVFYSGAFNSLKIDDQFSFIVEKSHIAQLPGLSQA